MTERRDIELEPVASDTVGASGRNVVTVIGIDRYQSWRRLTNAVADARGAAALFGRLGFEQITAPLLDGSAYLGHQFVVIGHAICIGGVARIAAERV